MKYDTGLDGSMSVNLMILTCPDQETSQGKNNQNPCLDYKIHS